MLPSDFFRRQVFANYWYEDLKPWHIEAIGEDNLLFETDYPHQTCLDKEEIETSIHEGLAGVSEKTKEKILWRNAASLFNMDIARLESLT